MAERTVHFVPEITEPRRQISYQLRHDAGASGPNFASLVSGFRILAASSRKSRLLSSAAC
ncbi:MAG: hypothetical protein WBF47_17850 [Xanthobacteraceae bacterium]